MKNSMSGARSAAASQAKSSASNAIRKAITNSRTALKKQTSIAPIEGGGRK